MRIKTIPIGQMLVLALLIFLVGIVITAVMKKANMSSKIRRIVFWGSVIVGVVVALAGRINGLFIHQVPYTWSLYPWKVATIIESVIVFLSSWVIIAVIVALFAAPILLCERVIEYVIGYGFDKLPKMASKISKWYHNLVK